MQQAMIGNGMKVHDVTGHDKVACGRKVSWLSGTSEVVDCRGCLKARKSGITVLADLLSLDGGRTPATVTVVETVTNAPAIPGHHWKRHTQPGESVWAGSTYQLVVDGTTCQVAATVQHRGNGLWAAAPCYWGMSGLTKDFWTGESLADAFANVVAFMDFLTRARATGMNALDIARLDWRTWQAETPEPVTPAIDLFDRARFLGYSDDGAARVADVFDVRAGYPGEECETHIGMRRFDDGECESCTVVAKSDALGYVPADTVARCQACRTSPASSTLDTHGKFIGSTVAPDNPSVLVCDRCYGRVMDSVREGEDTTVVYLVFPQRDAVTKNAHVVIREATRYPDADIADRARKVADTLNPSYVLPVAGYTVIDPAARTTFDVSLDGCTSEVRELAPSEVKSLVWEQYGNPSFRCRPRLTIDLVKLPAHRIADAESAEIFRVSSDGVTGRLHNPSFNHQVTRFTGNCCDRAASIPGHLHMSAVATVIALYPGTSGVRIDCRIGDAFTIDGVRYTLTNQRYADPILVPLT